VIIALVFAFAYASRRLPVWLVDGCTTPVPSYARKIGALSSKNRYRQVGDQRLNTDEGEVGGSILLSTVDLPMEIKVFKTTSSKRRPTLVGIR
jgi:hypothetical protein